MTALTASTKAKDLFKRVWVTNGAGQFEDKSLEQANKENQVDFFKPLDKTKGFFFFVQSVLCPTI